MPRHDNAKVQNDILTFITDYVNTYGYPPLVSEIAAGVDRSRRSIPHHLEDMASQGLLTLGPGPRAIAIGGFQRAPVRPPKPAEPETHQDLVEEAADRIDKVLPDLAPEVRTKLAEAVAGAVERQKST